MTGQNSALHFTTDMGASLNYVDKQGGGRGSPKCQRYYIRLFNKLVKEGVKNTQTSVYVVYGYPQSP